jgi:hypothetical protein
MNTIPIPMISIATGIMEVKYAKVFFTFNGKEK